MNEGVVRHAVVTGAARGIGAAIARALAADGMRLTLLGRHRGALEGLANEMPQARVVVADVARADEVAAAFAQARDNFGPIDVLVNNAGQAHSAPFLKADAVLWDHMLAVNLHGTVHCTREALPDMLAAGWGRVVNVASTAAQRGYAYVSAYCAAKHAVLGLTRALALEVATKGVTINAVCPGYTETDLLKDSIANIMAKTGRSEDEARAQLAAGNPQRRLVQPDEVAQAVRWLCQSGAGAVTGQAISVSGGEVM